MIKWTILFSLFRIDIYLVIGINLVSNHVIITGFSDTFLSLAPSH
jgi:hypothetical protein